MKKNILVSMFILSAAVLVNGCAAVVGAGAGTVAGIQYSDRGVKGDVKGSLNEVDNNAKSTFKEMGIQAVTTGTNVEKQEQKLTGKTGDKEVTVDMKSLDKNVTHIEIVVSEGPVKWNKDYAKEVLSKIIKKS